MTDTNVSLLALMSSNTVSAGISPQTQESKESLLPDFGNLLSRTGQKQNVWQSSGTVENASPTPAVRDKKNTGNSVSENRDSSRVTVKKATQPDSAKEKIARKLAGADHSEDAQLVDVEAALEQISEQIVQIVTRGLEIDTQQLMEALEELGLTVGDLLESSNLADLFSFFSEDAQPLELLMDPEFQNLLTEMNAFTGELAQQMDTTVSETVELIVQALKEQQAQQDMSEDIMAQQPEEEALQLAEVQETVEESVEQVIEQPDRKPEVISSVAKNEAQTVTEVVAEEKSETLESRETEETPLVSVTSDSEEASAMEEEDSGTEDLFGKQKKDFFHEDGPSQNVTSAHTQSATMVTPEGTVTEQTVKVVDLQNLVTEITEYVKLTSTNNQVSSIEMQLNPANLGKVLVEVATEQGEVTAKIATQTEAAKEAMEANISVLRENLEQQGVKVNAVEVTVQSHAFEENLQEDGSKEQEQLAKEMQKENRRVNVNLNEMTLDDLQGLMSEEDLVIAKMMRDNGNVINIGA